MKDILKRSATAALVVLAAPSAYATNGYFLPGFGVKSQGAGGVGIAVQADALSQAANPANATQTGMRVDLGLSLFNPERKSKTGPESPASEGGFGFNAESQSGNRLYLMPDMAFTMPVNERLSVGVAVVGNGGMNTTYKENIFASPGLAPLAAAAGIAGSQPDSSLGVDLMQVIAPVTAAYKLSDQHSIGASINLAAQRFKANGIGQFAFFGISSDPEHMTNQGYDYSYGAGVRLGWLGKFANDRVSLGATWASKTYMTKLDKYRGLFAEQGDFDIPETYGMGLAVKATETLTVAADVVRIKYSDVAAIGNPGPGTATGSGVSQSEILLLALSPSAAGKLGNDEGMGFGWKDMTVYKLGLIYAATPDLTLRLGYNYGKTPVRNDQLVFSALAPGIVERHYSLGFTKKIKGEIDWELSGTYMYVANNTQEGCAQAVVDCVSFSMHQHVLGVGFGVQY
ncbi:long-chain fatty acid transport protein [Thiobacillus denitrificans ATCC 25259]|uniref:Long-chain fatty acid transport protein n=1 Tax=Thiobacillus denitrificans (strain ATCC 25259 / T1) TaxID=292415 RepID=Q3SHY1_THIDA|nr:outer membrane protein transport protein [Thiobacillus denitrificans]AAZ97752.1 long-chain fatty acid transport protein [Thiobacillus denitrificans ATCC 25259]